MKTGTTLMSVDDIRAATAEVVALHRKMTFVVPLTPAERREHRSAKVGSKTLRTVETSADKAA